MMGYNGGFKRFLVAFGIFVTLGFLALVFGGMSAQAEPDFAERCKNLKGQARGLCAAASYEGCFDSLDSEKCTTLLYTWENHCFGCIGSAPPWIKCPCTTPPHPSFFEVNDAFEAAAENCSSDPITGICGGSPDDLKAVIGRECYPYGDTGTYYDLIVTGVTNIPVNLRCGYGLKIDDFDIYKYGVQNLSQWEYTACLEEAWELMRKLTIANAGCHLD